MEGPGTLWQTKLIEEYESKIAKLTEDLAASKKTIKEQKRTFKKRIDLCRLESDHWWRESQTVLAMLEKWKKRTRKAERRVRKFFDSAKKRGGSSGGTG